MIVLATLYAAGMAVGAGITWLKLRPKLEQLARLTDRDERGRFKGGKP